MPPLEDHSVRGPRVLPAWQFLLPTLLLAVAVGLHGSQRPLPSWLLPAEVIASVLSLFLLGSFKYQFSKNVLAFGWLPLEVVTWTVTRWQVHGRGEPFLMSLRHDVREIPWSWRFLDKLFHADTLLFIAALSFFVAAFAQTRALESIALRLLFRRKGRVLSTVLSLSAVVALASGILDGVSMVGLLVRTVSIVTMLAGCSMAATRRTIVLGAMVTTVCGLWLAYGEPPNLIMAANVVRPDGQRMLDDRFFLTWCMPAAVLSFGVVAWELRRALGDARVDLSSIDLMERNVATLRFMQAMRLGRMLTDVELVEEHAGSLGERREGVIRALKEGRSLGDSLVMCDVPEEVRLRILGDCSAPEHGEIMDKHFVARADGRVEEAEEAAREFYLRLKPPAMQRVRTRVFGIYGIAVFILLLVVHGVTHAIPLFVPPLVGFAIVMAGLVQYKNIRMLAVKDAMHEVAEYTFLLPLFTAVSLLSASGFFERLREPFVSSIDDLGPAAVALQQLVGAGLLSAVLDNNVVADFGSRLLLGLPDGLVYLFSMAQITGYAIGGCWTHVGSAQSIVAFAFVRRDVDEAFTPVAWVREMTGPVLKVGLVLSGYVLIVALLSR